MSYVAAINWNEFTAIATGVLALGLIPTAVGIWVTYNAARDDLRATQEAARAAYRPLLIDVAPHGPVSDTDELLSTYSAPRINVEFPGGHAADIDPRRVYVALAGGWAPIAIPLRNVGRGLAVVDPQGITAHGQLLGDMGGCLVQRERVPPGEMTRIVCSPRLHPAQGQEIARPWILTLRILYRDFAGGQPAEAVVELEQPFAEDEWRLRDVKQEPGARSE